MKTIFKSFLALFVLTLLANINLAMGQTVNMNRWIELKYRYAGGLMHFKFTADSPNTKVKLVCGILDLDTTFTIGTNWTNFSFYSPGDSLTLYGDITEFDCSDNFISVLNVSNNTALKTLYCQNNTLTSLDLSGFIALENLKCNSNEISSLNLSSCTALKNLECSSGYLLSLNVSNLVNLEDLKCCNSKLSSLNLSGCTALKSVVCCSSNLTSLNLSGCTALHRLECIYCSNLSSLDLSGLSALELLICYSNNLSSLNLNGCTALRYISCYNNNLSSLDISDCTSLESLFCYSNNLSSLDLSGHTTLRKLNCNNNNLASLDLSDCSALNMLFCENNNFTSLNLSGCTVLKDLWCRNNNISSIKLGSSENLYSVFCGNNNLSACGLDSLFHQLPKKSDYQYPVVVIEDNPGTYSCRDTIAYNRNWSVSNNYNHITNTNYECPYFTVGVEEMNNRINALVYPNPVSNNLYIECENDIKSIEIYDALGRKIISKEDNSDKTSIDFSNLGNGVYILKLRVAEGTGEFKVIKN